MIQPSVRRMPRVPTISRRQEQEPGEEELAQEAALEATPMAAPAAHTPAVT